MSTSNIKFAVLRTRDGHATEPLRPESVVRAGVAGHFEILPMGEYRVAVDGIACEGKPPKWPADHKPGKAVVVIEQIVHGAVKDTANGSVTIVSDTVPAVVTATVAKTDPESEGVAE